MSEHSEPVPVPGREGWYENHKGEIYEGFLHKEERLRRESLDASEATAKTKLCPFIKTPTGNCVGTACMAFVEGVSVSYPSGYINGHPAGPPNRWPTGHYYCSKTGREP